jgi:CRISPR-associated protein Csd1
MSWIQDLYTTYENCQTEIGYSKVDNSERPLLPICHTTSRAQIEITLDAKGLFKKAKIVFDQKENGTTIIPCTEGSGSRAGSKPENHPLCDKLQYVAGDFLDFGGEVTSGFLKNPQEPHNNYLQILTSWCNSPYSHPKAETILNYTKRNCVIQDLVNERILLLNSKGKFCSKQEANKDKNIFSVLNSQEDAFIRWIVEIPNDSNFSQVWLDKSLYESWINYYLGTKVKQPVCFVTGKESILTDIHPKYIRREGDGAKIISSNDNSGFTFRGRFLTSEQACNVSLEASQKAHYALSWLISRQGYVSGDLAIVAWAISGIKVPNPVEDLFSLVGIEGLASDHPEEVDTAQKVALQLKKKLAGYSAAMGNTTDVVVMGVDSATPGRLSIIYYQKLKGSDFLARINQWHEGCSWLHNFRSIDSIDLQTGKKKFRPLPFIGAPSPKEIAEAAYGSRVDDKLVSATIKRILPCIVDGSPIPRDLVESTVRRACNRSGKEKWEWEKTLSIACSLFKKYKAKEKFDMALDENRKSRDYLYGRLLALAESLEEWALNDAHENRETNASRLMQRFAEHPFSTWKTIEMALTPYKARLGGKAFKRLRMIDEVIAAFTPDDFTSDKRLSGEFLLGYHCQRTALRPSNETIQDVIDNNNNSEQ